MDHLSRSLLNAFAFQPLDRVAHLRKEDKWVAEQFNQPDAQCYFVCGREIVVHEEQPLCLTPRDALAHVVQERIYFLGLDGNQPIFIAYLPSSTTQVNNHTLMSQTLHDLYTQQDKKIISQLAYGLFLINWQKITRYCFRCGSSYISKDAGHAKQCSNEDCKHTEFPRINPAVIMRVTCGDKLLLGRQANWPEHRYSVLAGFVETGETLEAAVVREVQEETGVVVKDVNYHSSQPWPFPNSLMLGFSATTDNMTLHLDDDDIEKALWLSAEELIKHMQAGTVIPSMSMSISHHLIDDWFKQQTGLSLQQFQPDNSVKPILSSRSGDKK